MLRCLPVLLAACVAIISGLIGAVGLRALAEYETLSVEPHPMTLEQFASDRPEDKYRFHLTDLQHGASVYPEPVRDDGSWETVYVCLFPKRMKRLGVNYASVIVKFDGVKGSEQLGELLNDGELNVFYWPEKQTLPDDVYNRMAKKYRGMLFEQCIHCETGGEPPSQDFGNSCIYAGTAGVSLSFIGLVGFYLVRMIRRRKISNPSRSEEEQHSGQNVGAQNGGFCDKWLNSQNPLT